MEAALVMLLGHPNSRHFREPVSPAVPFYYDQVQVSTPAPRWHR